VAARQKPAATAAPEPLLELPGMFEDPRIPLARFDGQTRWQLAGERIDVVRRNLGADGISRLCLVELIVDGNVDVTHLPCPRYFFPNDFLVLLEDP
jgi:hypothetical protein